MRFHLVWLAAVAGAVSPVNAQAPPSAIDTSRVWVRAEYLLWWTQGASLPPLVTASPVGTPRATTGVLGAPTTTIVFGDSRIGDGLRSGARFGLGGWFDDEQSLGLETSFFFLAPDGAGFRAASGGNPQLDRPFFNVVTNRPDAELVAFPGVLNGAVAALASTSVGGPR